MIYNKKLYDLRISKNYSKESMARLLCISKSQYYRIENGLCCLTYDMAIKIAHIFDTTPDNIFLEEHTKYLTVNFKKGKDICNV